MEKTLVAPFKQEQGFELVLVLFGLGFLTSVNFILGDRLMGYQERDWRKE